MEPNIKEVAGRIRALRQDMDLTMQEMADATGRTLSEYAAQESGEHDLSFTFLYKCAERLGVDVIELLTGENPHLAGYSLTRAADGLSIKRRAGFEYLHKAPHFKNKLADNAKIIYVNTKDKKGVEGGSITVAADDSNGVKIANVVYVIAVAGDDDANKITWLFVDTNNDLEKVANPVDAAKATNETTVDAAITTLKTAAAAGAKTASSATEVTLASNLPAGTTATLGEAGTTTINAVRVDGTNLKATAPTAIVAGKVVVNVTVTAGTGVTAVSKTVAIEYTVAAHA